MKKFRKLIPALAMLLVSAVLMSTASYAWFSMNTTVTATGMKVQAKAEGSLVITNTSTLPADGTTTTQYNFADASATELLASTMDWTVGDTTGLKFVNNASLINPETGSAKNSSTTLTYDAVPASGSSPYYKDYSVLIASDKQALDDQDIVITLTGTSSNSYNVNKAISIAFYGNIVSTATGATVSSSNLLGVLNVANVKNNTDDKSTDAFVSFEAENINIPKTGSGTAYAVTMRVFYDGALIQDGGTQTYTAYKAGTGTATAGSYYYTDNAGSAVATVASGADVTSYFVVDDEASTYRFAKSADVASIETVTLTAAFTAKTHD